MCKDCGCSINNNDHHHHHSHENIQTNPQLNDPKTISIVTKILDQNDQEAERVRAHFNHQNVVAINLMSSPGAGKTALLEELVTTDLKFCVIEGDLETSKDADRLKAKGISAIQIQTGSACHLDAFMVHKALHEIEIDGMDVCFIENVGNLVCPAAYDVGSHLNIVLVSVPEGDDKIEKYPVMFRAADLVLITKTDLLPHFDFKVDYSKKAARNLKPNVDIIEISTKDHHSIQKVVKWIKSKKLAI